MTPFNYEDAIAYIHAAHENGKKNDLANMRLLLARLGNPEARFPALHVTGTNGKGSVCALLNAALQCSGYRTGLYTSPFLQRYNERMRIDGAPIPNARLAALLDTVAPHIEALRAEGVCPTEFEIGTALAFTYFAEENVDIAVVEVGLGGRLDPTNVLIPRVCAIASIGLDHTRVLGDTIEAIAGEKAGIAKPGVPLVLSAQGPESARAVVRARCEAVCAPFHVTDDAATVPTVGLQGAHQAYNAALAARVLHVLVEQGWRVPDEAIAEGFRRARWPGRLEWVGGKPPLLMDGAHNPEGARALAAYVASLPRVRTAMLLGMLMDKDWPEMARTLAPLADAVVTVSPDNYRALDAGALAKAVGEQGVPAEAAAALPDALARARELAGPSGRVVAAGSLYLIGSLRTLVLGQDDALLTSE